MHDALDRLVTTRQLKVQPTSKSELAGFLANADQAPATLASTLNRYHSKRNRSEYEGLVSATDAEALDMVALAADLKLLVLGWLRKHRPELLA